jgi:hypothetical protein
LSNTHDGSTLGASSFVELGTFSLFGFSSRKIRSTPVNGAYASTFVIQGLVFGKPTNKRKKGIDIKSVFKEEWAT